MTQIPPSELDSRYTSLSAKTGRMIREDGTTVNQADSILATPGYASREGRFYRAYWSGVVPTLSSVYFRLNVPAGIKLYGFDRLSTVINGQLNSTFLVGGTPGSVQDTKNGFNFDETLGGNTAGATLQKVASLTGGSPRTPAIPIVAPSTGPTRTPSGQTETGLQPAFNQTYFPAFQYDNPDDVDTPTLYLQLTWQEIEI